MTNSHEQFQAPGLSTDQIAGITPGIRQSQAEQYDGHEETPAVEAQRPVARASTDGSMSGNDANPEVNAEHRPIQLLGDDEHQAMLERWREIQSEFVDEPRHAIDDADALVAELLQRLARGFAQEREQLDAQLRDTSEVSTEDMRQGLRRYRSFFERLLAA